ncbi:MAG: heparinase II/III family protein [Candidatus Puniceispirillaceae bacterium]
MRATEGLTKPKHINRPLATPVWRITTMERLVRQSAMFRWQMRGPLPDWPSGKLIDPWRGHHVRGSQLVQGGLSHILKDDDYHNFSWLRDIRDYGGAAGRSLARDHIEKWCRRNSNWQEELYRPDRLGNRLTNLLFTLSWFGETATDEFQHLLMQSLSFQTKILSVDWQRLNDVSRQIMALKGLYIAQVMLRRDDRDIAALLDVVLQKAKSLLNPDWGHKSRAPEKHLRLLRDLIEVRQASLLNDSPPSGDLEEMITNMGNLMKLWRHSNGEFAHFQGAGLSTADAIEEVLKNCGPKGKIVPQAPHTGFLRLSAARNTLIMDAGTPVSPKSDNDISCASTFAFEFSVANARFIVGAGQYTQDKRLAMALSKTAAHSALTLDGIDSSDISVNRFAEITNVEAGPAEGGMLAIGTHNGYQKSHGILHHRQIYLTASGDNLRGSDELEYTGDPGEIPAFAELRFHMHPRVSAALLNDKRILLKIQGQKAGWIFKSSGGTPDLEPSLYFDNGRRTSCQQIVLKVPLSQIRSVGKIEARWAFIKSTTRK